MALVQPNQVAEWLKWDADQIQTQQNELQRITDTAVTTVERLCGSRQFVATTETRMFDIDYKTRERTIGDVSAVTSVEVSRDNGQSYMTLSTSAYRIAPLVHGRPLSRIRRIDGRPFFPSFDGLRIAATWGVSPTPPDIIQAVLMAASKLVYRYQTPNNTLTNFEGEDFELGLRQDPDFMNLIDNWKLPVMA